MFKNGSRSKKVMVLKVNVSIYIYLFNAIKATEAQNTLSRLGSNPVTMNQKLS